MFLVSVACNKENMLYFRAGL